MGGSSKNNPEHESEMKAFCTHLKEVVLKSQDSFEKQLSYISAGSLSISMAFIKNVVGDLSNTIYEGFLIASWGLMGSCSRVAGVYWGLAP